MTGSAPHVTPLDREVDSLCPAFQKQKILALCTHASCHLTCCNWNPAKGTKSSVSSNTAQVMWNVHYSVAQGMFIRNTSGNNNSKTFTKSSCINNACHIQGVPKKFGEWYQKTNKTDDTNKLNLLSFKIIAILHNTLLAMFIKLLETVSKGVLLVDNRPERGSSSVVSFPSRKRLNQS